MDWISSRASDRGIAAMRRALPHAEPATESPMETRLRMLLVLAGLPRPLAQVTLTDEHGGFLGRPDLYYPKHRLGLEYDGETHHHSLVDDNRRQNRLATAGVRLLRFTAADLYANPDGIVRQVRALRQERMTVAGTSLRWEPAPKPLARAVARRQQPAARPTPLSLEVGSRLPSHSPAA